MVWQAPSFIIISDCAVISECKAKRIATDDHSLWWTLVGFGFQEKGRRGSISDLCQHYCMTSDILLTLFPLLSSPVSSTLVPKQ